MDINALLQMIGPAGGGDPNNTNPNLPPMQMEDEENGYWDAKNMGNGKGKSFAMENGQQRAMDPTGNGAMMEELMGMIGGPGGGFDADAFASQRNKAWSKNQDGGEGGFDSETLQMLIDQLDGEGVNQLSGNDISKAMLRGEMSPEDDAAYSQLGAQEKMEILENLVNSDGLGNIPEIMKFMSKGVM